MNSTPTAGSLASHSDRVFERQMRDMNEALLVSSVRLHELAELAHHAEAQARVSEDRYRTLFNSIDEGFCVIEMLFGGDGAPVDYRFLEVNPAFARQYGLHDAVGKRMRELEPNHEAFWFETFGKVAVTGESVRCASEAKALGRWFDLNAFRIGGSASRLVAILFTDISGRIRMERELAKALVYADDIITTLPEPFLVLDRELRVKTANRSFYETFHVAKEETENRLVYDLGNGQWDIPDLRKLLTEVLSCCQSVHDFAVEHVFPELGRKTMLLNARSFPPDSKHPELILLAVEDVSEVRKRADDLATTNRHKDEFLAMLGHELRNPLAPILNAVQLLRHQNGENRVQKQAHDIIERQVAQLVHLVDDLLEVSRVSTGKIHLQRTRNDLRVIARHGVETARSLIEQCRHALDVSLPPSPIWINGDAIRLEQVLVNLLNNAAKYTEIDGHIWLSLQQEGDEAVLRVRDSGVGIAAELLPRIFELFTQADRSLARSQGGLGIGLSLAQRLVNMHGGTIMAHSVLGQGSEFVVRLPVSEEADGGMTDEFGPGLSGTMLAPPPSSLRVLVVDDNTDAATILAMLLRKSGHDVRIALDGPAALEAALDFRPDAALLDIGLPGLDGFEVAKRLRQQPLHQNVVLVALTGYGQESDRQRSREAGFDHYLVKPTNFEKLQEILAAVAAKTT